MTTLVFVTSISWCSLDCHKYEVIVTTLVFLEYHRFRSSGFCLCGWSCVVFDWCRTKAVFIRIVINAEIEFMMQLSVR